MPFRLNFIWLTNWAPPRPRPQSLPPYLLPAFIKFLTFVWLWKPAVIKYQIGGYYVGSTWVFGLLALSSMTTWDMVRILLITKEAAISLILYNLLKSFQRENGLGEGLFWANGVWLMIRPSLSLSNSLSVLGSLELSESKNCAHPVCWCIPRAQYKGLTL